MIASRTQAFGGSGMPTGGSIANKPASGPLGLYDARALGVMPSLRERETMKSAQFMRRGAVEDAIKSDPFSGNTLIAEGMRQDLYQQRYEQRMKKADDSMQKMLQQRQQSQIANQPTYTPTAPNYSSARKRTRRPQGLAALRAM